MLRISDIKFPKSEKIRNANSNVDINENISHDQIQTQNEDRYDYEYDEEDRVIINRILNTLAKDTPLFSIKNPITNSNYDK